MSQVSQPSEAVQTAQTAQTGVPMGVAAGVGVFPVLQRVDSVVLNDSTQTLEAMGMRRCEPGGGD